MASLRLGAIFVGYLEALKVVCNSHWVHQDLAGEQADALAWARDEFSRLAVIAKEGPRPHVVGDVGCMHKTVQDEALAVLWVLDRVLAATQPLVEEVGDTGGAL